MKTVCLLGNGASVPYNSALSVEALTDALVGGFRGAGPSEAGQTLARFAGAISGSQADQFEALLGPISTTADALRDLEEIATLASQASEARAAIATTSSFLKEVHRRGVAITLGHIAACTVGHAERWDEVVDTLGEALSALGAAGDLTVATLNYDGLTHSALLDAWRDGWGQHTGRIADLARGSGDRRWEIVPGHRLRGWPIRVFDDVPAGYAAVLQLHGSLAWLRPQSSQGAWKFQLRDLRDACYWDHLAEGSTDWEPVVVLTDRKQEAVGRRPFSLAYEIFRERLVSADRWLIAGFSFGDLPVNATLTVAARLRKAFGLQSPRILIIDIGERAGAHQRTLAGLTGYPSHSIVATGEGLPAAFATNEWAAWAGP